MGGMTDWLGVRIMCLYGSTYGLVIQCMSGIKQFVFAICWHITLQC